MSVAPAFVRCGLQISSHTANFNEAFFGGRSATTNKMDLLYTEEMWQFFTSGSEVEELASKLGYDLHDVAKLPNAIMQ